MGWLKRLFGEDKPKSAKTAETRDVQHTVTRDSGQEIPPERLGLNGEYDESGLAKRVALAFDNETELDDIETLYVAQTSSTVVLKGSVPSQAVLDRMVMVAERVQGAESVQTDQVSIG